jgi:hypothetical protein
MKNMHDFQQVRWGEVYLSRYSPWIQVIRKAIISFKGLSNFLLTTRQQQVFKVPGRSSVEKKKYFENKRFSVEIKIHVQEKKPSLGPAVIQ